MLSTAFYAATKEYSTLENWVPAPYMRRALTVRAGLKNATLTVCGLGFYRVFADGQEYTKGIIAPYVSNPDDFLYYDSYDLTAVLTEGKHAIGFILGNGMLNCVGGQPWGFHNARWRSAPKVAFALELTYEDGGRETIEASEQLRCAPSPIIFDDFRGGEWYDATREIEGWCSPDFDDSAWTSALPAETPRGTCRLCDCEPIVTREERKAVNIYRGGIAEFGTMRSDYPVLPMEGVEGYEKGWIYDFGVNSAGLCRLHINAKAGQKLVLQFAEEVDIKGEGNLDLRGVNLLPSRINQRDCYICREGEQTFRPNFTYHGFRYCLVLGLEDEQATEDLLTYEIMSSDIKKIGDFSCSDDTLNRLEKATQVSDLANFFYLPTDCPHREKNGWTGDIALSCEQIMSRFDASRSLEQWLDNVLAAQLPDGRLPGIVPTAGWGFHWGNGPAWDNAMFEIPYVLYRYRGNTDVIRRVAAGLFHYLQYMSSRRNAEGLLEYGLDDWCHVGHQYENMMKCPLVVSDSTTCLSMCYKAEVMFRAIGKTLEADYAHALHESIRAAFREHLVDSRFVVAGNCQTAQAMAIHYGVFDKAEIPQAFSVLLKQIEVAGNKMDVGVLGARTLFRVLSACGRTDLAYEMITTREFPSYAYWIHTMGATSLLEDFTPYGVGILRSHNHHFWGDIVSWFTRELAGLKINPYGSDCNQVEISPVLLEALTHAETYYDAPAGRISVRWERKDGEITLTVDAPDKVWGRILIDRDWQLENGICAVPVKSGSYRLIPAGAVNTRQVVPQE